MAPSPPSRLRIAAVSVAVVVAVSVAVVVATVGAAVPVVGGSTEQAASASTAQDARIVGFPLMRSSERVPAPAIAIAIAPESAGRAQWAWPLAGRRVIARAFLAPPHAYGPGHRGVDLRAESAERSDALGVAAPADGVVAFAGTVADRPLLTIDHGHGVVTTLEPVLTSVRAGELVERGQSVGILSAGGHAAAGTLHLGVRVAGEYVNPLLFLGGLQRARLLPLG